MRGASTYHSRVFDLLRSDRHLQALGFENNPHNFWLAPRGSNRHDLIVIAKVAWRLPCSDAKCGYEGVYPHFEYEQPGTLYLHVELYPRRQSEKKHPQDQIQPLLNLKGGIAGCIRELAVREDWTDRLGWIESRKNLQEPGNLQVGKFDLGLPEIHGPEDAAHAIVAVVAEGVPGIDEIVCETN